jgi:uncharacterized protein YndB with AHSA1/START domain
MKTIHHVLDIDSDSARIWDALTLPEQLMAWWSTKLSTLLTPTGKTRVDWTFVGDFNPVMEVSTLVPGLELRWRCIGGHQPWADSIFLFRLDPMEDGRTRLRFWQEYAVELDDDAYGSYNFNWGYYLESLRLLCTTGAGKPFVVEGNK